MATLPSSLALTSIADGASIVASDHRNNNSSVQTAVNALLGILDDGAAGNNLFSGVGSTVGFVGAYTAYTPVWTATGVAPALGNATVTVRYLQLGSLVHYAGQVTFGGTSTFGTGAYFFSLPVARSASAMTRGSGMVFGYDTSANATLIGQADTTGSVSTFSTVYGATYLGAATNLGQAAPWAWASGDTISWNLLYEAA